MSVDPVDAGAPVPEAAPDAGTPTPGASTSAHRPLLERLGMASIALVLAVLFGAVAAASWVGHEPFLAIMAGIGALMTAWAGVITITRG